MKQVRAVASQNSRDFSREELADIHVVLEPWLTESRLVNAYHVACTIDKTALRFMLPAQHAWDLKELPVPSPDGVDEEAIKRFDKLLGAGIMIIPRDAVAKVEGEDPEWGTGAIVVEYHLILQQKVEDKVSTVCGKVRVFPRCGACRKVPTEEPKKRMVCTGCSIAFYCDKECQRKDWDKHRPYCKAIQGSAPKIGGPKGGAPVAEAPKKD